MVLDVRVVVWHLEVAFWPDAWASVMAKNKGHLSLASD